MFDLVKMVPKDADDVAKEYEAYYGDSSPLVTAFIEQSKPVMIANYD